MYVCMYVCRTLAQYRPLTATETFKS